MSSRKARVMSAIVTTFVVVAGTAWAGEAQTEIKITDEIDVAGKVQSTVNQCKDERKVVLLKKRSGKDKKMGADTADGTGRFSFGNPGLGPGRYYVKAKRIRGSCAKGLSEVWRISSSG